ncbi:MAG TPA: class I SAM-dependent methyltransferase [Thermoplasmata archaeon]|nr:class I SAM-dependent methyltransferase [Thermoplasmata archaeon]
MIEDLRARLSGVLQGPARIALRSVWTPARSEYLGRALEATMDPAVLLGQMVGPGAAELPQELPGPTSPKFSALWPIDPATQRFLGGFVRSVRPKRFLETGVADGTSTRIILDALEANGDGRLWSVDVSPEAGDLARQSTAVHRWEFVVLPARGRAAAFRRAIRPLRPLDVFLHDSDHSYPWQMFEYREAWSALAPGGWLLSDDIDASYAFLDFAARCGLRPWVLVGPRKLFGVLRKPAVPTASPH